MKRNTIWKLIPLLLIAVVLLSGCNLNDWIVVEDPNAQCEACSFGEWSIVQNASCHQEGAMTRTCTACGYVQTAPIKKTDCKFGAWATVTEPTVDAVGLQERVCSVCGQKQTEELAKLVDNFSITCDLGDKRVIVTAEADGSYVLEDPTRVGYEFLGWKTESDEDFAKTGVIEEDIKIKAIWQVAETTTFEQLKSRLEGGAAEILLCGDIVMTETIYVTGVSKVTATGAYTLTRSPSFNGDLFFLGETAEGENSVLTTGKAASLTFMTEGEGASLTVDGNKANMTVDVLGTVFFLYNSSTVSLFENVTITNCKKVGNIRIMEEDDLLSQPQRVGGAAVIVADGVLNLFGATISECEVNLTDKKTVEVEGETQEISYDSSCGGAIFNRSTVNMYSGTLKNNQASRGAAIFNYRTCNIKGGLIDGNYAETYGAALYMTDSQYTNASIGDAEAEEIKLTISNNSAKKSGGAVFGQHQSALVIYNGVEFNSNKSLTSNGGAINMAGSVTVKGGLFINNVAASKGGAMYVYYSDAEQTLREVTIEAGYFEGNEAAKGGAIGIGASNKDLGKGAKVKIGDATFYRNRAFLTEEESPTFIDNQPREGVTKAENGEGGALYVFYKATVEICGSARFEENSSESKGGAIYLTTEGSQLNVNATAEKYPAFVQNQAGGNGGAIYVNDAEMNVNYATFTGNKSNDASYGGGALYFTGGKATLSNVTFEDNVATAQNGGAICAYSSSTVSLTNATFKGNVATNNGGAVYVNKSELQVSDSNFEANQASGSSYGGGAIYLTGGEATLTNVTFKSNASLTKNGGAIAAYASSAVQINGATFTGNTANDAGGAIALNKSTLTATTMTFTGNATTGNGGAIHSKNSTLTADTVVCENNSAKGGGAIYTEADGMDTKLNVTTLTVRGNAATNGNGGALYFYTDSVNEIGTLIADQNTATSYGGAIYASGASTTTVNTVTATANEAKKGGFLYETTKSTVFTILSGSASENVAPDGGATIFVNSKSSVLKLPATGFTYPEGSVQGVDGFAVTILSAEAAA